MVESSTKVRMTIPQASDQAVAFHRQGYLTDAETIYADILKVEPNHFDSIHMLGLIRYQQGRMPEALTLLERALTLQPNSAEALSNYGITLRALNRWPDALDAFDRAIKLRPTYPEAHSNRGTLLIDLDRADDALESFNRALTFRRGFVDALFGRGLALIKVKRLTDALVAFDRVLAAAPNHVEALTQRIGVLYELHRYEEVVASCDQLIRIDSANAMAHYSRGVALTALGRVADAAASYQRAIAIWPDHVPALFNLANALQQLGQYDEALAALDRCLVLDPKHFRGWSNHGNILFNTGRYEDAMASYDRAIAINPDFGEAYYNKGNVLRELERVPEAADHFQKAVELRSDHPDIPFNEGLTLLLLGNLRAGFKRYEGRFQKTGRAPQIRKFSQRLWTGFDISDKRILLHDEQGLGDAIHFARYVPLVAQRGAEVILEVQTPLKSLLASVKGVSRVYARGDPLPAFDVHQYLLSLGAVFETDLDSIPADIPYLTVPADRVVKWRERLPPTQGLRVGLVWAGNPDFSADAARSIGLARLAPILSVPGVQFVSLHRELRAEDAPHSKMFPQLIHFGTELTDLADTAAVVSQLDLVIGSDTAVIHLAGALGKPVWLLTKFSPDWRWMLNRQDNPWYPTATLYRQPQIGDWQSVIERVRHDLIDRAAGQR